MFEDDLGKKYIDSLNKNLGYMMNFAGFKNFTIVDKPSFEHPESGKNILVSTYVLTDIVDLMKKNKGNHIYLFAAGCDFERESLRLYIDKKGA